VKHVYEHLDLVVCMYAQPFYAINNFPYMMPTQHGKVENMKGSFETYLGSWMVTIHYTMGH
jgi:hypothetical protein